MIHAREGHRLGIQLGDDLKVDPDHSHKHLRNKAAMPVYDLNGGNSEW